MTALLASAAGPAAESMGDQIIGHVSNGPAIIPLYFGPLDMSISKHVIMLWLAAAITLALFVWYSSRLKRSADGVPSGWFATMIDYAVESIHKQIVIPAIGSKWAPTWTPLIAGYFFFILTCNLVGLTPVMEIIGFFGEKAQLPFLAALAHGGATPTGNYNVTAGLAVVTFGAIILAGSKAHGFFGHWKNLIPHGTPIFIVPLLLAIEIMSMFVKPFALTMRLAANMTGGHLAIIAIFSVIFVLKMSLIGVAAVPLVGAVMLLEIIVSLVQAYVFTLLSAVFIGMAINVQH